MDGPAHKYKCTYLISKETKQKCDHKNPSDKLFSFYDGQDESFYFPMVGLTDASRKRVKNQGQLTIDPWPAFIDSRASTETQIFVAKGGRLFAQGKDESKLPLVAKPRFLEMLEAKIKKSMSTHGVTDGAVGALSLQIYQEAFELYIQQCAYYGPLLAKIKWQYESFIDQLRQEIKRLLPIKEMLWTVSMESEQRVNAFQSKESKEITRLQEEKQKAILKLEKMKQECVELTVTVKKLTENLEDQATKERLEADGRKLLLTEVNELTSRLREMEQLARAEMDRTAEDPIKLRIQLDQCRKAVVAANKQITVLASKYDDTVAVSKYEEVRRALEVSNAENEKLKEDLESAQMRYNVLQDHCSTLSTYRDLFNFQLIYITRALNSKSEASQKVEYLIALISKYRRLVDKPIEELSRIVEEEMQRAESGGLPTIARPSSSKSRAKNSVTEK
uniref:Translin-associated factor X-interacting protein 1 n=1 Tax=Schistocephalus solidus TaxID=70667 RepID=A0A0X3NSP2_SCHSO